MAAVVRAARDAGAAHAWCRMLDLRPGTREHFLEHLARDWPDQVARYERLYRGRAYVPAASQEPPRRALREALARTPLTPPPVIQPRPADPEPMLWAAPDQLELELIPAAVAPRTPGSLPTRSR